MSLELVTGYKGEAHVTASQVGAFNKVVIERETAVFNGFDATILNANTVRVSSGDLIFQGRHIHLADGDHVDLNFDGGTAGVYRNDLVAVQYNRDQETNVESASLVIIKGTGVSSQSAVQDPAYTDADIDAAFMAQLPLWRIRINGTSVSEYPEQLFVRSSNFDAYGAMFMAKPELSDSYIQHQSREVAIYNKGDARSTTLHAVDINNSPMSTWFLVTITAEYVEEEGTDGQEWTLPIEAEIDMYIDNIKITTICLYYNGVMTKASSSSPSRPWPKYTTHIGPFPAPMKSTWMKGSNVGQYGTVGIDFNIKAGAVGKYTFEVCRMISPMYENISALESEFLA